MTPRFDRLYPIVDIGPDESPDRGIAIAGAVLEAGASWLQLRCKARPAESHLRIARTLVAMARRSGAGVIVNDRLDVALLSGAQGVHLGQEDLPLADARRMAPTHLIVGISTHSAAEASAAAAAGADYVGFGPMFPTASKADALSPRLLAELSTARAAIGIPIVAIGGISEATAPRVLAAGADSVAMIGALRAADDPRGLASRLLAL